MANWDETCSQAAGNKPTKEKTMKTFEEHAKELLTLAWARLDPLWSARYDIETYLKENFVLKEVSEEEDEAFLKLLDITDYWRHTAERWQKIAEAYMALIAGETPSTCTREGDHICRINGPCNGFPKVEKIIAAQEQ